MFDADYINHNDHRAQSNRSNNYRTFSRVDWVPILIKVGRSGSVVRKSHSLSRGPRFQYSSKWVVVAQWLEDRTLSREDRGSNTHQSGS